MSDGSQTSQTRLLERCSTRRSLCRGILGRCPDHPHADTAASGAVRPSSEWSMAASANAQAILTSSAN